MTELERLTAYYDAVHRGEEPPELTPEEVAQRGSEDAELRIVHGPARTTASREAGGPPRNEGHSNGDAGGASEPGLLLRRPRLATLPARPKKSRRWLYYAAAAVAGLAVLSRLSWALQGLGLWMSAGAGGVVGVVLVQWLLGRGVRPRAKTKTAEELRHASDGLKAQHRGDHDAVGNRTFQLRGARVQVLDVRVMEGSYATYRITVSCAGQAWDVWHRYAEFDLLRAALDSAGALPDTIPALPPKTFGHRFDQTFLLGRKDKLRAFMGALVAHETVCDRDDVRRFLLMPPLPHGAVAAPARSGVEDSSSGWLGRLMGTPQPAPAAPALTTTRQGSFESLSPAGAGRDGLYETETGEQVTVRMWKSPFKRSTLREILDEFSDAGPDNAFTVRGLHYCTSGHPEYRKKIKAGPALLELLHVDVFAVDEREFPEGRHFHVAARGMARERVAHFRTMPSKPFLFIHNLQIPGDPPVSIVQYFGIAESLLQSVDPHQLLPTDASPETKFYHIFRRFCDFENTHAPCAPGEPEPPSSGILPRDDFRNERFKLLPFLHEAPWIVKNAVPVKPAIMGKKLVCRFFRSAGYVEVDVDVASEPIARNLVGLCRGYARQLVVDIGVVLQGEGEAELPERVAAVSRYHSIDMDFVQHLEEVI